MNAEGGCYCKGLRYALEGEPMFQGFCHCRECQYITGGGPNVVMALPEAGFRFTKGEPKGFTRTDLDSPVTREFCPECGTHIVSRAPGLPGAVILKVGTLDDPSEFGQPQMAIFGIDRQPFHQLIESGPTFERGPGTAEVK